jgi:hypothetical protein
MRQLSVSTLLIGGGGKKTRPKVEVRGIENLPGCHSYSLSLSSDIDWSL